MEPRDPERRRAERFRITVPVRLEQGTGRTRDISTDGVFFETSQRWLSVGAPVKLALLFRRVRAGRLPVEVECEGHVVRVEELGEQIGVAVVFTAYAFGSEQLQRA